MANLCTSSCICVSRRKRGEFCFSPMVCGGKPYSSSDVRCFPVFGKSGNGDVKVQFVDNLFYGAHLPFSAVGDKKVGQGSVLLDSALITPFYNLFHGCIVVRSFHSLDVILPVVFLGRLSFDEDNASGNRVRALDVGVVKTL